MTKPIARRNIGGLVPIAGRQIATKLKPATPEPSVYSSGAFTFAPARAGRWKFVLNGGGGNTASGSDSGASGAYCEITRRLLATDAVALSVGTSQAASTATFPDGTVVTAGGAAGPVAGIASGGDVNLNGSAGVANASGSGAPGGAGTGAGGGGGINGGSGAPANLPYHGGLGQVAGASTAVGVGAGAGQAGIPINGGSGRTVAVFMGD